MSQFVLTGVENNKQPMAKYMKNQFQFVGTKSPERKAQSRALIKQSKQLPISELLQLVTQLYLRNEREYQYVAIDVSVANVRRLNLQTLQSFTKFVPQKAWWDSVDSWRKLFGDYVRYHPDEKKIVFNWFFKNENFWMRRISILLQLLEKSAVDQQLLTQAIEYDIKTNEFFIQKAIGWALRDYSKTNPQWVTDFISTHQLTKLAKTEGSKYI